MLQARAQNAFQVRVDLGEQAAEPIADAGYLARQIVVEADEHLQLSDGLVFDLDRAERVRHDAGRLRDDERVASVGLRLTWVEAGDPTHGQSGQVGNRAAHLTGDRERQGADGGWLVDHNKHGSVLRLELAEELAELGFAVGQPLVEGLLPSRVTAVAWCSPLPTSRPRKTPMSLTSIMCVLRSSSPGRPTAPIATSTLRRASRPADKPVVMPLISGLSMPPGR